MSDHTPVRKGSSANATANQAVWTKVIDRLNSLEKEVELIKAIVIDGKKKQSA